MQRQCNECTLCCKLLPVKEIGKAANTKCIHQRSIQGCMIYQKASFPHSCRAWSCAWLINPECIGMDRPDRAHYVIDIMPDFITAQHDSGESVHFPVVQVWIDPKHRDAHKDPALRKFLEKRFERFGEFALLRFSDVEAVLLIPPAVSPTGDWYIKESNTKAGPEHSIEEIMKVLE